MSGVGRRSVLAALGANVAVAVTKLVGFVITGSSSMLAESLHSLADSGNQLLLLLGAKRADESPSPDHPFGRGRERYFWAFIVGLVLFGFGGAFSVIEGVQRLRSSTHEVANPEVALAILGAAVCIESFSFRRAIGEARTIRPSGQSWPAFLQRTKNPEVSVVILEDGAALAGLALALAGVSASWLTGSATWDAVATIGIGVLLCGVATFLTIEMKGLLVGETITAVQHAALWDAIADVDGVDSVLNLRSEHIGPEQVLICVKIALDGAPDFDRVVDIIEAVEQRAAEIVPHLLTCYVEPDRFDARRVEGAWT